MRRKRARARGWLLALLLITGWAVGATFLVLRAEPGLLHPHPPQLLSGGARPRPPAAGAGHPPAAPPHPGG